MTWWETSMEKPGRRHKWSVQNLQIRLLFKIYCHVQNAFDIYRLRQWVGEKHRKPYLSDQVLNISTITQVRDDWYSLSHLNWLALLDLSPQQLLSNRKLDKSTWSFNITQGKMPLTERKVCIPIKLLHTKVYSGIFHDTYFSTKVPESPVLWYQL